MSRSTIKPAHSKKKNWGHKTSRRKWLTSNTGGGGSSLPTGCISGTAFLTTRTKLPVFEAKKALSKNKIILQPSPSIVHFHVVEYYLTLQLNDAQELDTSNPLLEQHRIYPQSFCCTRCWHNNNKRQCSIVDYRQAKAKTLYIPLTSF